MRGGGKTRAAALVARRELAQQLHGKALWISTALTLLGIALVIVLPNVISSGRDHYRVAVRGDASIAALVRTSAAQSGVDVTVGAAPAGDPAAALQGTASSDVVVLGDPPAVYVEHRPEATSSLATLVTALSRNLAVTRALADAHLTAAQQQALLHPTPVPVQALQPPPSTQSGRAVALAGSVLFFFLAMRYGVGLLVGVAQEKGSRVIEIVLSAVRPVDLLSGKIAAGVAIVTAQAVLLAATALIAAKAVGSDILQGGGVGQIVLEGVWIVLGFLIYAALFTAAGSMASKPEDAQAVSLPVQLLLFIGYFASFSATGGDVTPILRVLAYVPFTAPMNMPLLWAAGGAGAVQVAVSMLITVVTIALVTRLAAGVFSASVLRTGQRVRLRALLRERRAA